MQIYNGKWRRGQCGQKFHKTLGEGKKKEKVYFNGFCILDLAAPSEQIFMET
jgi:hypothetical protein